MLTFLHFVFLPCAFHCPDSRLEHQSHSCHIEREMERNALVFQFRGINVIDFFLHSLTLTEVCCPPLTHAVICLSAWSVFRLRTGSDGSEVYKLLSIFVHTKHIHCFLLFLVSFCHALALCGLHAACTMSLSNL